MLVLILSFSVFTIIESTKVHADSKGNTIAGVEVDGLKASEIEQTLQSAISMWQSEPLIVEGGGYLIEIDKSLVEFDLATTISTYETLTEQPWYAFWKDEKEIHIPLQIVNSDLIRLEVEKVAAWDTDVTTSNILGQVSLLKMDPVQAEVGDFSSLQNERLAFEIQTIPVESKGVYDLAIALDETIVAPGDVFSFIETVGNIINSSNTEGTSFVASILYATVLKTNSIIHERYSQSKISEYLEPGIEVLVAASENKDFKFSNNSELPIFIKSSIEANQLKMELYSSANVDQVSVQVVQSDEIKPKSITRYTDELAIGKSKIIEPGKKGLRVFVYRTINGEEQTPIREYYAPENRIILKSSRILQQPSSGTNSSGVANDNSNDPDLNVDLDGDGLPDENDDSNTKPDLDVDELGNPILPEGSYYDKAGNLIQK